MKTSMTIKSIALITLLGAAFAAPVLAQGGPGMGGGPCVQNGGAGAGGQGMGPGGRGGLSCIIKACSYQCSCNRLLLMVCWSWH